MTQPSYLKDLNEQQLAAVTAPSGPVLVLAGAGSGKTRTLIHRLAYLVEEVKLSPAHIIALTFTNKAAQEIKSRAAALLNRSSANLGCLIGTFHSVSTRFLRRSASQLGFPPGFSIYDQADQLSLIRTIIKDLGYNQREVSAGAVAGLISRSKADLLSPTDYKERLGSHNKFTSLVAEIYGRYQTALFKNQAMDFDDLINQQVKLWQENSQLLRQYQERFSYILVDEYQDTNHAQYLWTKLLVGPAANLYAVGDDWQSIYSWRGADFGNILRFNQDYPQAKIYKLERNYRSTANIIAAGNAVMAPAEFKTDKKLWTANVAGRPLKVVELYDEISEANWVVEEIINLSATSDLIKGEPMYLPDQETGLLPDVGQGSWLYQGDGRELAGFVVLYRTNAQSRALEEACLKKGLPYRLVGGTRFYERQEIKDILAYLRLLINDRDGASLRRAALTPRRGLGETSLDKIISLAQTQDVALLSSSLSNHGLSGSKLAGWQSLIKLYNKWLQLLPKLTVAELIDEVLQSSGLKKELLDGSAEGKARYENIEELKTVAVERTPGQGREALIEFLTDVSLWQDQDELASKQPGGLTLMTLHSAKGLEFDTVFLVGMEEGLFPHSSSFSEPKELEEERRLCYVGLTRARRLVYCTYATNRRLFGSVMLGLPSRFLGDLPRDLIDFQAPTPF